MNEITLNDVIRSINKNKKFILTITLSIILITIIATLLWPKTYESISEIQLAQLMPAGQITAQTTPDIFSVIESKNIVKSTSVVSPAISKYAPEITYADFIEGNLDINIISERIGKDEKAVNYLKITTRYNDAEKAKKINEEIISNFINYTDPYYSARLQVLENDLTDTTSYIQELKLEIKNIQNEISQLRNSQLSSEGISKSTLLSNILSEYQISLSQEQDRIVDLNNKIETKREYAIISEPQIPDKPISPNILINILVSLILGFIISFLWVFIRDNK